MDVITSNTYTAANTNEATLVDDTTARLKYFRCNLLNMVAGDIISIRIASKVLNGGTLSNWANPTFAHAQVTPLKEFGPFPSDQELVVYVTQSVKAGANYTAIPWSLMGIDDTAGITAIKTQTDALSNIEASMTLSAVLRIILAAVAGKTMNGQTKFRNAADTKDRISAVITGGDRTSITLDGS